MKQFIPVIAMIIITTFMAVIIYYMLIKPNYVEYQIEPKEIESEYTISVLYGSQWEKTYYTNEILECKNSHTVLFIEAESGEEITLIGCQVKIREIK